MVGWVSFPAYLDGVLGGRCLCRRCLSAGLLVFGHLQRRRRRRRGKAEVAIPGIHRGGIRKAKRVTRAKELTSTARGENE